MTYDVAIAAYLWVGICWAGLYTMRFIRKWREGFSEEGEAMISSTDHLMIFIVGFIMLVVLTPLWFPHAVYFWNRGEVW